MKIEAKLDVDGLLEMARKFPDIVREETTRKLRVITARLEKDVVENTPAGVGGAAGLRGSIAGRVESSGQSIQGIVSTGMPYGEVVEVGRRPGSFPPVAPIALWAERKLGVFDHEAESVGFLIARKIFKVGTKGAHMFEKAWKKDQPWVLDQVREILTSVARRVNEL